MRFHLLICGCWAMPKTSDGEEGGALPDLPTEVMQADDFSSALAEPVGAEVVGMPGADTVSYVLKPIDSVASDGVCQHGNVCSGRGSYLYSLSSNPRTSSSRALVGGVEYNSFFVNPLAEGSHEEGAPIAYAGASVAALDKGLANPLAEEFAYSFSTPPESPCKAALKGSAVPSTSLGSANDPTAPAAPGTPTRGSTTVHSSRALLALTSHQPWKGMEQPPSDLDEPWEACTEALAGNPREQLPEPLQVTQRPACGSEQHTADNGMRSDGSPSAADEDGARAAAVEGCAAEEAQWGVVEGFQEAKPTDFGELVASTISPVGGRELAGGQDEGELLPSTPAPVPRSTVADSSVTKLPSLHELPTMQHLPDPYVPSQRGHDRPRSPPLQAQLVDLQEQYEQHAGAELPLQTPHPASMAEPSVGVAARCQSLHLDECATTPAGKGALEAGPAVAPRADAAEAETFAPCTPPLVPREPSLAAASTPEASPPVQLQPAADAPAVPLVVADAAASGQARSGRTVSSGGYCYDEIPAEDCREGEAVPAQDPTRRCLEPTLLLEAEPMEISLAQPVVCLHGLAAGRPGSPGPLAAQTSPSDRHHQQQFLLDLPERDSPASMPLPAADVAMAQGAVCPIDCSAYGIRVGSADCTATALVTPATKQGAAPLAVKAAGGFSLGGAVMHDGKAGGSFGGALEHIRAPLSTPGAPQTDPGCSISGLAMTRALIRQLGLLPGPRSGGEAALPLPSTLAAAAAQQARLEALARILPSANTTAAASGTGALGATAGCSNGAAAPSPFASACQAAAVALQQPWDACAADQPPAVRAWPATPANEEDLGKGAYTSSSLGRPDRVPLRHRLGKATGPAHADRTEPVGLGGEALAGVRMDVAGPNDSGYEGRYGYAEQKEAEGYDGGYSTSSSSSCLSLLDQDSGVVEAEGLRVISVRSIQGWLEPEGWKPLRERYGGAGR